MIRRLDTSRPDFEEQFAATVLVDTALDPQIERTAEAIVADVRARGDAALLEYTRRFDRLVVNDAAALELPLEALHAALETLPAEQRDALALWTAFSHARVAMIPTRHSPS